MARVTVEDCVLKVPNRFDLVMLAAQRSRDISAGSSLTVERDDDKNPVVALREIADETIGIDDLGESLIEGMQKHVEIDEPEEELQDFEMAIVAMGAESAEGLQDPAVAADALSYEDVGETEAGQIEAGEIEAGEIEAGEIEAGEIEDGSAQAGGEQEEDDTLGT